MTRFDNLIHQRIYRINLGEQITLELLEFKKAEFKGYLINSVSKVDRKNNFELISIKIKVPDKTVQTLMDELKAKQFETILDCENTPNCLKGFDGTTTSFTSITNNAFHEYSYWEVERDFYYKDKAIPNEVLQVRELLSIVNNKINLKQEFRNFLDRLPIGSYSYGGVTMTKISKIN
ncbi:hypothetical protein OIU83_06020 [Flavobacterium sp. LS1R49]|uniref:Uncharacterized protein n=1 Tax=Flavobacterium shii TaxID=2987687 RepID=A0A9X2YU13_9FLAO|nr:hypothetical protein [Flavobacterium shii]MCV9927198.1 hypothetical protein [Flavobacterium shii]